MQALAPVVLTGNQQTISLPNILPGPQPIRFANESAYALSIALGGDTHWLQPWTVDVFTPARQLDKVTITPTILTTSLPSVPTSKLVITVCEPGEHFGGSFPLNLDRLTSTYQPAQLLGTFTVALGGGTANRTYTLPFGTLGIGVSMSLGPPRSGDQVIVTGPTTGAYYFDNITPLGQSYVVVPVDSVNDPTINVKVNTGAGGGTMTVYVTALLNAGAVVNQFNSSQVVQLQDFAGLGITSENAIVLTGASGHNNLGATLEQSKPPPWLAATAIAHINANILAGANLALVAAAGGVTVYLHDLDVEQVGAVASNELGLQDTSAVAYHGFDMATVSHHKPFKGTPLPIGRGAQLNNAGAVTVGVRGSLTYSTG